LKEAILIGADPADIEDDRTRFSSREIYPDPQF
jgi:hypothetical protein